MNSIRKPETIKSQIKDLKGLIDKTKAAFKQYPNEKSLKMMLEQDEFQLKSLENELKTSEAIYDEKYIELIKGSDVFKFGWIPKVKKNPVLQLDEVFKFFNSWGFDNIINLWDKKSLAYRKTSFFEGNKLANLLWLRKGEIEAEKMNLPKYDENKFWSILPQIRNLTKEHPQTFCDNIRKYCKDCGVALIFIQELKGSTACGATQWIDGNPLIQLSLRYKTNDHFWFTFFHEAGHVLKHKDKMFIEFAKSVSNQDEKEADKFASDFLIPEQDYKTLRYYDRDSILRLANTINIHPGIIVGRLQHEKKIEWSWFNDLKVSYRWSESK